MAHAKANSLGQVFERLTAKVNDRIEPGNGIRFDGGAIFAVAEQRGNPVIAFIRRVGAVESSRPRSPLISSALREDAEDWQ